MRPHYIRKAAAVPQQAAFNGRGNRADNGLFCALENFSTAVPMPPPRGDGRRVLQEGAGKKQFFQLQELKSELKKLLHKGNDPH